MKEKSRFWFRTVLLLLCLALAAAFAAGCDEEKDPSDGDTGGTTETPDPGDNPGGSDEDKPDPEDPEKGTFELILRLEGGGSVSVIFGQGGQVDTGESYSVIDVEKGQSVLLTASEQGAESGFLAWKRGGQTVGEELEYRIDSMEDDVELTAVWGEPPAPVFPEYETELRDGLWTAVRYTGTAAEVEVPEGIGAIGRGAFADSGIKTLVLPDSVERFYPGALFGTGSLETLELPFVGGMRNDGNALEYLFGHEEYDGSYYIDKNEEGDAGNYWGEYYLPESLQTLTVRGGTIPENGICDIRTLQRLVLGDGVELADNAVHTCYGLREIVWPAEIEVIPAGMLMWTGFTELILPDTVREIGENALSNLHALKELVLPEGLQKVHGYGFTGLWVLEELSLPSSLTEIGERAFMGSAIRNITIPAGAILGEGAFYGCSIGELTLSEGVTVGPYAFENCVNLEKVNYPAQRIDIGNMAFADTPYLAGLYENGEGVVYVQDTAYAYLGTEPTVTVRAGTRRIGEYFLASAPDVTEISLPDGLLEIGDYAFAGSAISELIVPESVQRFGVQIADGCENLRKVTTPPPAEWMNGAGAVDAHGYSFGNFPLEELILTGTGRFVGAGYEETLRRVTVGEGITVIGTIAFSVHTALAEVILSEGLQEIEDSAFYGCTALAQLEIPASVHTLGRTVLGASDGRLVIPENAQLVNFRDDLCDPLDELLQTQAAGTPVYLGRCLYGIARAEEASTGGFTVREGTVRIRDRAFSGMQSLRRVVLPGSLREIGSGAFSECGSLSEIVLPDGLEKIGSGAFFGCAALEEMDLPESVTEIGAHALHDTMYYHSLPDGPVRFGSMLYAYKGSCPETAYRVPDGVTVIVEGALDGTGITRLELPESVLYVGGQQIELALLRVEGEPELTGFLFGGEAVLELSVGFLNRWSDSVANAIDRLTGGGELLRVLLTVIGPGELEESVLSNEERLVSLTVGAGVRVGRNAFFGNRSLQELTIEDGAVISGDSAFAYAESLESVRLPSSVRELPARTFAGSGLRSVEMAEWGLESIGDEAFYGCEALETIRFSRCIQVIGDRAFGIGAPEWLEPGIPEEEYPPEEEQRIQWTLPATVLHVGERAFARRRLPEGFLAGASSLRTIGASAFFRAVFSGDLVLPDSLREIGERAFERAETQGYSEEPPVLDLGDGLERIGDYAFCCLNGFGKVVFPDSLERVGAHAFDENDIPAQNLLSKDSALSHIGDFGLAGVRAEEIFVGPALESVGEWAFYAYRLGNILSAGQGGRYRALDGCLVEGDTILFGSLAGNIPADPSVRRIGAYAFWYVGDPAYGEEIRPLHIGENILEIGEGAFTGCSNLEITGGAEVREIGNNAFTNTSMRSVSFPKLERLGTGVFSGTPVEEFDLGLITELPAATFSGVTSSSITLPASIVRIGSGAFSSSSLQTVVLHDGVTEIGERAFADCSELRNFVWPARLQIIGKGAFSAASALSGEVRLPEGLLEIGEHAFHSCDGITALIVPDTVTKIGLEILYPHSGDSAVTELRLPFFGDGSDPATMGMSYYFGWSMDVSRDTGLETLAITQPVTALAPGAFAEHTQLSSLTWTPRLTVLPERAFLNCGSLTALDLGADLTEVGTDALTGLSSLKELVIPGGVTALSAGVLSGADSLEKLEFPVLPQEEYAKNVFSSLFNRYQGEWWVPEGLTEIVYTGTALNDETFANLTAVEKISVPYVTELPFRCFEGCTSLSTLEMGSVKKIGTWAFAGCAALKMDENFLQGVEELETEALKDLSQDLYLPESIVRVASGAVSGNLEFQITVYVAWQEGNRPAGWEETWCNNVLNIVYGYGGR